MDQSKTREAKAGGLVATAGRPAATMITDLGRDAPIGHAGAIAQLRRALRRERQLGLAGHDAYSLERHMELRCRLDAIADKTSPPHGLGEPCFGATSVSSPTYH